MKTIIENPHPFAKDIILEIDDDILTWIIDGKKINYSILSANDYVNFICKVWDFVGSSLVISRKYIANEMVINGVNVVERTQALMVSSDDEDYQKIDTMNVMEYVQKIYDIKINRNIQFIYLSTCECNMGNCRTILDKQCMDRCDTFGDLFKQIGTSKTIGDKIYYEYPDSVWLFMNLLKGHVKIYENCGSDNFIKYNVEEDDKLFVTCSYTR